MFGVGLGEFHLQDETEGEDAVAEEGEGDRSVTFAEASHLFGIWH